MIGFKISGQTNSAELATLFSLISVGYHSELHVAIMFTYIIVFYQISRIIFFSVHTNY